MSYPRTCCQLGSLLLLALAAIAGCSNARPGAEATPPPPVLVATPINDKVTDYQDFTARTQAIKSVDIKPRVTGYLVKICFKDGDTVKKDQVLFEIDDRPYKASLDAAKADLEVRKAAQVKSKAVYDIGLAVQKQDKSAISMQELDKRKGDWDETVAAVDQAKAALDKAQLYYDWCKVLSPLDGRANRHFIDIGNLISQDMSVLTNIVSIEGLWAYFNVDENTVEHYMKLVQEGQIKPERDNTIPIKMALGSGDNYSIDGYIDFLSNQLDPNTGSIMMRAVFPNKDGRLIAGMFGRIRVPIGAEHPALLVVDSAIGTGQDVRFLYIVNDKDVVEYRRVEVGQVHRFGSASLREVKRYQTVREPGPDGKDVVKQVEVLKPTDRIIVEGLMRVRPGATVRPTVVDMETLAPPGKAKSPPPVKAK
jgi:RND family efflux transporter MFP subunit